MFALGIVYLRSMLMELIRPWGGLKRGTKGEDEMIKKIVAEIDEALKDLKNQVVSLVEEARQLLKSIRIQKQHQEDVQKKARPIWVYIRERDGYETISIVWSQVMFFSKGKNLPHYRDISRGRSYRISKGRFLKYVAGYHPQIQEELWDYEKAFGEFRKRQALLNKARINLQQFQKEAIKPIGEV
jgi:Skp family chaperone for outer membrane proteins